MIKVIGDQKKIVSEINITPLVDTLLVLLIIFMVTAPAMTRSVGIELPKPKHGSAAERVSQEKKFCCCPMFGLRKFNTNRAGHCRSSNHENNQQDQEGINQRGDIDF